MATSQQSAPAVITPRTQTGGKSGATLLQQAGVALLYLIAILTALMFSLPFLWTLGSSLKSAQEIFAFPPTMFPVVPRWQNYADVFRLAPFLRFIGNTI